MRKGENIYKRKDGRWEGRYIKGRTAEQKIMYGYIYGKRYSDVKMKLVILRAQHQITSSNSQEDGYDRKYSEWLCTTFFPMIEKKVKDSTYTTYYCFTYLHILPFFREKRFSELDEDIFQAFVLSLYEKGLRVSSIRLIFSFVKQSITEAIKQQYIEINPIQNIHFPNEAKVQIRALSLKQQQELEKIAKDSEYGLPIFISLYSGLRIGEICGLTWDDIDFDQQIIRVNKTVSRVKCKELGTKKTQVITHSPKTQFSNRVVPMPIVLYDYLKEAKKTSTSTMVISTKFGIAEPRIIGYHFKKLIVKTDFSTIHFHVLRHTFATRCLEQGMDVVTLSRIMGHHSSKLTLDTYSDSLIDHKIKEIRKLDSLYI